MAESLDISLLKKIGDMWIKVPPINGHMTYSFSSFPEMEDENGDFYKAITLYKVAPWGLIATDRRSSNITYFRDLYGYNIQFGRYTGISARLVLYTMYYNFGILDLLPMFRSSGAYRIETTQIYNDTEILKYTISFTIDNDGRLTQCSYENNSSSPYNMMRNVTFSYSGSTGRGVIIPIFFAGTLAPNGFFNSDGLFYVIDKESHLYWNEHNEFIYFDTCNMGSIDSSIANPQIVNSGSTIRLPAPKMKAGYIAKGWRITERNPDNYDAPLVDKVLQIGDEYNIEQIFDAQRNTKFTLMYYASNTIGRNNLSRKMGFR